jgi:hypothetical protein
MILRVDANLKQEIIVITADKGRLCLRDAVDNMERSRAWQTPAGIFATILVVFPVSTFQDFLGISKDTWKALSSPQPCFSLAGSFAVCSKSRSLPRSSRL